MEDYKYSQNTQYDSSSLTVHKKRYLSEVKLNALGYWHILPLVNTAAKRLSAYFGLFTVRYSCRIQS